MPSHRRHLCLSAAVAGAVALAGTVALVPAAAAAAGVTTSLPARTTSVPAADEVSGSGQTVVWQQKTSADTLPHGWLSVSGGTPQDLGVPADNSEGVHLDTVSVQHSVVAVATSTNPNGALADHVTLRHLDTGRQETLPVAYDGSGAAGDERYRGQAGDGILVQQAYYDADSAYRVRLVLRTSDGDRTLLSDDEQYEVLASDADGALVRLRTAPGWGYRIVYVDFATGTTVTVAEPSTEELPQGLEFTPTHFGVVDGATLTEWQRSAPGGDPATVTLPTDKARWISDDTLAWYEWSADGNELYAMSRDGSTAAADLGGTFRDISVGDDGRMRASLYRPDVDAAVQTLTDGRVSTAGGDATTIPAGPARLDALALSGGTLYTADDSSRRTGVLLSSGLTVGTSGASATAPSRVLAYSTGIVHQTLAAAGHRVLVEQGDAYQVYDNGTLTGVPLQLSDTSADQVVDFDGSHFLLSDTTTVNNGTLLLYTVATGASERVAPGSALYGGALYTSVKDATSSWSIRRTDLAAGTTSTVTTVDCLPGGLQARGSWILLTTCGAASTQGLLIKAGTTTRTPVDASVMAPILGKDVLYTFTKPATTGIVLNAQVLGVPGATAQPLFAVPERADSASAQRWAVDREAPWAAWMDSDGVTHTTWAGAPARTAAAASVPTGFSPNGDGSSDTWAPVWAYDRPVAWTLTLKSGTTTVRTLTGTASGGKVAPVWNGGNDAGAAAAEGSYSWTLALKDAVTGVPAAGAGGTVTLRRTVPAASVTAPVLASDASTSAVIPVGWAAKTAGVTSYDVSWRVATRSSTGVWTLGSPQTWRSRTTTKSGSFGASGSPVTPKPGLTYRFYVRAHDDAGQTGPWSAAVAAGVPVDDRSASLTYSGRWVSSSVTSAWARTERVSATKGATVSFTADGTKLRIVATRRSDGGRFAVVVDGATVGTVNTYASSTGYRKVVFTYTLGTRITTHKAQLKVLSGSATGRSTVHLDAIMITR
ncbi:RHS repeat domain-containing protein [Streptomyces cellulosae]|uniref:Fibronectin type-III domain-containing protein n=1 Tax=Streptomyces cellulosae TaxID=1968 RepID=A0ABW7Y323_STRCE